MSLTTTWRQLSSSSRLLSESLDRRTSKISSIDFSTRVNIYYSFTSFNNGLLLPGRLSSHGIRSRQRRYMSSDDKKQKPSVTTSTPVGAEETGRLGGIVPALRQRVTEFNTGDLVSVYGIVLLIVAIVFAPFIANQMRKSDNMYEDVDFDDSIAHTESIHRSSKLKEEQRQKRLIKTALEEGDEAFSATGRPKSVDNTVNMITDVLYSEALQSALASLITRVLDSEQFQRACQTLLKNLWNDLVNDPETTAQIVQLLQNAIENKEIQRSVKKLVMQIIDDKEVYDELTRLLVRLGQEKEVLDATQSLLTESTHNALNDPEILDHSMEFATDVVGDDIVQRTSGEALRNTVTYAVRPGISTFLSIVGAGLLLFGLSALANARASEHEAAIVEKAITAVARNLSTTTATGMGALLSLPSRLLSGCLSFLMSIASFPVKLIQRGLSRMGRTGDSAIHAVASVFNYVGSLPSALYQAMLSSMGQVCTLLGENTSRVLHGMLASVSVSFVGVGYRTVIEMGQRGTIAISNGFGAYTESLKALVSVTLNTYDASTVWIDTVIDALARSTVAAVNATIRSSETASEVVGNFVSTLIESITNRGGGGSSATM